MRNTNGNVQYSYQVQFPITDSLQAFQEAEERYLREVHPDHRAIIERFQAYHRIHEEVTVAGPYFHPLALLRELSNTDKHRLLNTVLIPSTGIEDPAGVIGAASVIFISGTLQQLFSPNVTEARPVEMGTEISRAKFDGPVFGTEVETAGYVLPQVALPEGWGLVAVVDKITTVVVMAIREFERFF